MHAMLPTLAVTALFAFIVSLVYAFVSRLLTHPLKLIPGPRLAALTDLYAAYFEVWKEGLLVHQLEYLHSIYGPAVRIRPNEVHFNSPEAYFAIYATPSGFTKDPSFYNTFSSADSSFGFTDVRVHKERVELLNPLFSRRAILKFEHVIQDTVNLLLQQLRAYKASQPVNLHAAFRAFTMDVITTYSYGHSFGGLIAPGFNHSIPHSIDNALVIAVLSRYFPPLRLFQFVPPGMLKALGKDVMGFAETHNFLSSQIDGVLADPDTLQKDSHETIYHHLLPNDVDPKRWPTKESLIGEAQALLGAGTDTVANTANVGFYHILSQKEVKQALDIELERAWPEKDSPFSYEQAEKLPYLTAVLKESLRMSIGVSAPLPRIVGSTTGAMIDGVYVPHGAAVSVSATFVLMNHEIFPEPEKFKPERWLQPDSAKLDKFLVVFSKGPRSCIGINLAWCELYNIFSHLLRNFDMELHDVRPEDMMKRDYFVPVWIGKGLRVLLQERSE